MQKESCGQNDFLSDLRAKRETIKEREQNSCSRSFIVEDNSAVRALDHWPEEPQKYGAENMYRLYSDRY